MKVEEKVKTIISLTEEEKEILQKAQNVLSELCINLNNCHLKNDNEELILVEDLIKLRIRLGFISTYIEEIDPLIDNNHAISIDKP